MPVTVLAFIDEHWNAIIAVVAVCGAIQAVISHVRGNRLEEMFREISSPIQRFRETGASGRRMQPYSLSGAGRVLVAVVTDRELLIEGIWPIFTYLASRDGLAGRVPLTSIKRATADGKCVELLFIDDSGGDRQIRLHLADPNGFLSAAARCTQKIACGDFWEIPSFRRNHSHISMSAGSVITAGAAGVIANRLLALLCDRRR
jgi:hypothetical protein